MEATQRLSASAPRLFRNGNPIRVIVAIDLWLPVANQHVWSTKSTTHVRCAALPGEVPHGSHSTDGLPQIQHTVLWMAWGRVRRHDLASAVVQKRVTAEDVCTVTSSRARPRYRKFGPGPDHIIREYTSQLLKG